MRILFSRILFASVILISGVGCGPGAKPTKPISDEPPVLMVKPANMLQAVYDAIKDAGGGPTNYVVEKNEAISAIDEAIKNAKTPADVPARDAAITKALTGKTYFAGLDTTIIGLLPTLVPPPLVLLARPADMPKTVYAAIQNAGGASDHIADKNQAIPVIEAAIKGAKDPAGIDVRDQAITDALANKPHFLNLATSIIGMLITPKPNNMPKDVYEAIKGHADPESHIAEKNNAINKIAAKLDPEVNKNDRDGEIDSVLSVDPFTGSKLAETIIQLLEAKKPEEKKPEVEEKKPEVKAEGPMSVEFIKTTHITDSMFDFVKAFLLKNFDIKEDATSEVKVVLTSAISSQIDTFLDDDEEVKKGNRAVVFVQRTGPDPDQIDGAIKFHKTDYAFSAALIPHISDLPEVYLQSAGVGKKQPNSTDFCKMLNDVASKVKQPGQCKTKDDKDPYK